MGNMVVLQVLEKMSNPGSTFSPIIGEVINAAPDVDPDLFKTMVGTIKQKGGNFTLYASRNDWALWTSSEIRNRPRAGYIKDKPLIDARNFDTIDITQPASGWFDFNWFALNHDVYASSPVLVADIQRLIEMHEHLPPDRRTKEFEPVASQEGTYWLFRRPQAASAEAETSSLRSTSSPTQPIVATPPLATAIPQIPAVPSIAAAPPSTQVAPLPSETSALTPNAAAKAAMPVTPTSEAQVPVSPSVKPPPTATATTAPVKTAHRKKRRQDIDPDWNTKPLH
jgi:hypothetical protein